MVDEIKTSDAVKESGYFITGDRGLNELGTARHVLDPAGGQIIEHPDPVTSFQIRVGNVASNEPRPTRDQNLSRHSPLHRFHSAARTESVLLRRSPHSRRWLLLRAGARSA